MKVDAIVQARMGSTRLPGKVLMDIAGEPMLARVCDRTRQSKMLTEVIVATTTEPADDVIEEFCAHRGWKCYRGSEEDVLDRYYKVSLRQRSEAVIRITADCPLIDPQVVDQVLSAFLEARPDYASNVLERTYPRGLDTEVMTTVALARSWREATEPYQRVHVTPYICQNPQSFSLLSVKSNTDHSGCRWTVDTAQDLQFVRTVYDRLGSAGNFSWLEVLTLLEHEPALAHVNRHVQQKVLRAG